MKKAYPQIISNVISNPASAIASVRAAQLSLSNRLTHGYRTRAFIRAGEPCLRNRSHPFDAITGLINSVFVGAIITATTSALVAAIIEPESLSAWQIAQLLMK
jgi:hypothetical protein